MQAFVLETNMKILSKEKMYQVKKYVKSLLGVQNKYNLVDLCARVIEIVHDH